jgi:hypothetical protein
VLQPIVEVRRPARLRTLLLGALAAASAVTMTLFLISLQSRSCPYEATPKPVTRILAPAQAPPPAMKPLPKQAPEPLAALSAGEIEEQSAASLRAFQRCYQRARTADASFAAPKLGVTVTITSGGEVNAVELSAHGDTAFGRCITTVVRAWQFRWSQGGGTFRFNLRFD